MKALAIFRVPFGPLLGDLADCSVGRTGDVANDAVKTNSQIVSFLEHGMLHLREELCKMVRDDYIGSVKPIHLVSQHEGTLWVRVIRDNEARRHLGIRSAKGVNVMGLNQLQ